MISLKAQFTIIPEGRAAFAHHMQTLIAATLAEEACLGFACYEDLFAYDIFIILGEWQTLAALDEHEHAAHVATFKANSTPLIASRRETIVYETTYIGTLPLKPQSVE